VSAIKRTKGEKTFEIANVLIMLGMIFISFYPIWHVVMASFSGNNEIMAHRGILFKPAAFTLSAYNSVFESAAILRGYLNTVIIVVFGCALNITMTALGAYFLSRRDVMWKKPLTVLIIITMFFSGGLIPFYLTVKDLKMLDSLLAVIIPGAISTYNMVILRTAFQSIPESLEESARLDGASHITVLFRIVIPLSMSTIAVLLLYYGVGHWNAWFNAMLFLQKRRDLFPLQLILREMLIQNTNADSYNKSIDAAVVTETFKYAVIVVSTVPVLCVYPFLQKYFVKGVMIGAVKG
jgi:putative aldouronate transport system permease protein